MGWDTSRFFAAFERVGFLKEVTVMTGDSAGVILQAGYEEPTKVVLDGMVSTSDYRIEYEAAAASLKRGDTVLIGAITFRLKQKPSAGRDGAFSAAFLEVVA